MTWGGSNYHLKLSTGDYYHLATCALRSKVREINIIFQPTAHGRLQHVVNNNAEISGWRKAEQVNEFKHLPQSICIKSPRAHLQIPTHNTGISLRTLLTRNGNAHLLCTRPEIIWWNRWQTVFFGKFLLMISIVRLINLHLPTQNLSLFAAKGQHTIWPTWNCPKTLMFTPISSQILRYSLIALPLERKKINCSRWKAPLRLDACIS